jgi:hypothetical protein
MNGTIPDLKGPCLEKLMLRILGKVMQWMIFTRLLEKVID